MRILIASLLIVHGLIVAGQSAGSFAPGSHVANPGWLHWWPAALGQSWLFAALRAEGGAWQTVGGVLWLVGGVALVAAGLGLLGVVIPPGWWRTLALAGGVVSLAMLLIYLHPFLGVGIAASIGVLGLLWVQWTWLVELGL